MKKVFILALLVFLVNLDLLAQEKQWSLRDCCDHAVANNISVKQKAKDVEKQGYTLSTALNSRLPNLSGTASQNFSFGRGLTEDNIYANTNTSNTSLQLQTSVPIFTGFQIPENIKLNRLNLEAATADLEKAKNDIRMEVAKAYVQILYDQEISAVAHRQVAIDSMQVARLKAFVENGKASEAELSRQKATMANSQLTATQADNNTRLAILTLTQLLELTTPEGFQIVSPTEDELMHIADLSLALPDQIYQEALSVKPEIRSQELRLKGAEHSINIAKAGHYPKLNFSAGLGTNYYTTSGFPSNSFGEQVKNNFSQFIGLNLTIPIFDRFSVRNSVRSAKVDRENRQLTLDNTKKTLYKEIQQVYYNALNAQAKENSSRQAVISSKDAFELTQAKYENGKANITEFNEAKNTYLKSESDLVQARYEHLYQRALLDFYRGRELNF
ncbi:MAG: TolC family protein [Prevotella sp.]|jgi:outer membrane protein|nr:TolC family protein [Prevotella sp.]MBQ7426264.1 TolC family protein [Prevotella sp.]MBQ8990859.1 TolC family protein [Prevotella sp.]MBR0262245.1 TolC family protein [Prevotella sp.]